MTRRLKEAAAGLLALTSLACGAPSARGEAWVLWEKRMTFADGTEATPSLWEPLDGFAGLSSCQRAGEEMLQSGLEYMKSAGRRLVNARPDGRSAVYESNEGGTLRTVDVRYLCFPGGFDPRPDAAR